jgi:uncharacterized membrane protein YdbT with pleckstrin-like domain
MPDIIVRPTMKFVKAGYFGVLLFVALVFVICATQGWSFLIPAVLLVLLIWPLERHIKRLTEKMTIMDDKLRRESGLLRKNIETFQLVKIQDVKVSQSFADRLFRVGTISIETAGPSSRFLESKIDHPQAVADIIMQRAQHHWSAAGPQASSQP